MSMPSASAARCEQHRIADRLGRRGEDEQPGVGGQLEDALGVALLDLAGDRLAPRETRTRRPARPGPTCAAARTARAGCRGSPRRSDRRPPCPAGRAGCSSSSARASLVDEALEATARAARRGRRRHCPVRAAHTIAIRSASRRRATKPEDLRRGDGRATARRRRCRRAAAARRPRRTGSASPDRPGSGRAPARR